MKAIALRILFVFCLASVLTSTSFSKPIDSDTARAVGFAHMEAQNSARGMASLAPPRRSTDISEGARRKEGSDSVVPIPVSYGLCFFRIDSIGGVDVKPNLHKAEAVSI